MGKLCPTKARYNDELAAKIALAEVQSKPGHDEKRYYLCPFCHGFHLTSQDKKKK